MDNNVDILDYHEIIDLNKAGWYDYYLFLYLKYYLQLIRRKGLILEFSEKFEFKHLSERFHFVNRRFRELLLRKRLH